jgi:uncharacterized membrane protein
LDFKKERIHVLGGGVVQSDAHIIVPLKRLKPSVLLLSTSFTRLENLHLLNLTVCVCVCVCVCACVCVCERERRFRIKQNQLYCPVQNR